MGYYVHITDADWYIPTDKQDAAYKAVCALNERNDLKRGGISPRPEGLEQTTGANNYLWFSWMDAYYPETCPTLRAVLEQVGFDLYEDEDESLVISGYNSKSGQEDLFLWTIAPFAVAVRSEFPFVDWRGEEGEQWRNVVYEQRLYNQRIAMVPSGDPSLYEPSRW